MPNICYNKLEITGKQEFFENLINFVKGENGDLDFNKIIPYPKEFADADKRYSELSNEVKAKEIKISDGFTNGGYEWCVKNWGTKWNAQSSSAYIGIELTEIYFDTAWSPSLPVTAELAKRFPELKFVHKFEEGGMDFSGYADFEKDGKIDVLYGAFDEFPVSEHEGEEDEND